MLVISRQQSWRGAFTSVCLSVFQHNISKTDAARITKLDTEKLHDDYWKAINFTIRYNTVD